MSTFGSSSTTAYYRAPKPNTTSEERVFGPRFGARGVHDLPRNRSRDQLSLGLVSSAFILVLTVGVVFLLGVNIVIQYRTIVPEDRAGMVRKSCYIVASVMTIYGLNKLNEWLFKKMNFGSSGRGYERLQTQESFEMSEHVN